MTTDSDACISIDELVALDSATTLVVTVNNRYARRLVTAFSQRLGARRRVMAIPDVVPFAAWLRQLGGQLSFAAGATAPLHRLDAFAARHVWERAIAEVEHEHVLLDVRHAAQQAMEADRLVDDWRLRVGPEDETEEYHRFCLWRRRYEQLLGELDAEDDNREYRRLCLALADAGAPAGVKTVVTAGFAEFSPRQQSLLAALRKRSVNVARLSDRDRRDAGLKHVVAPDADAQWRMAARWASAQLRDSPNGTFAIVAPNLEEDAAFAHRVLRSALRTDGDDGAETGNGGRTAFCPVLPYNVAVARPLAQWFHVRAALAWLRALLSFARHRQCAPDVLGAALLAGACTGGREQASTRASYDVFLRRNGIIAVEHDDFSQWLSTHLPGLYEAWRTWLADVDGNARHASVDVWVASFRRWLQCMGFPGPEAQGTVDYQVLQAFDDMLGSLAAQAAVFGRVDADVAFSLVDRLAAETLFQPQRDPAARLDVLGLLESEGGQWDGVWVLGLTDETLPAAPRPNPLIPLSVLRRAGAPRATPERELAWAENIYRSLTTSAPRVWLCHPELDGEREVQPSPLLASVPEAEFSLASGQGEAAALEYVIDDNGPALAAGRKTKGGIGVIDTQARNPLWAFVKFRLGAYGLPGYAGIFDQNARGLFLHRAAELVWRMLDNQSALLQARESGRLSGLVRQAVEEAASQYLRIYSPVLKNLESARAVHVLSDWLEIDAQRMPFTVLGLERDYAWSSGPLTLSLRVDRIDQIEESDLRGQGGLVIIDYKSTMGSVDPKKNWMRERPVGLQLPFYAAVLADSPSAVASDVDGVERAVEDCDSVQGDSSVAALVLAKLHARKIETKGLARVDCGLPGVARLTDWPLFEHKSWGQVIAAWRTVIEQLARDYGEGVADNQSARRSDLDYCDVLPFLRLNEEVPGDR